MGYQQSLDQETGLTYPKGLVGCRNIASSLSGVVEWKRKASERLARLANLIASLLPCLTIWHNEDLHWLLRRIRRSLDGRRKRRGVSSQPTHSIRSRQSSSELQRLASLQENWDSQGARSIDPEIVAAAGEFVSTLPGRLKSRVSAPAVVPICQR